MLFVIMKVFIMLQVGLRLYLLNNHQVFEGQRSMFVYTHILCSAFGYYEESQLQLSHFQHSWWIKVMSLLFAGSNW